MGNRTLVGLAGLCLCAIGLLVQTMPVVAAVLCPPCLGMQRIAPGLIVEQGLTDSEQVLIRGYAATARQRVRSVLGPMPRFMAIVACTSAACQDRFGANGPRAQSYGVPDIAVIQLMPKGVNPVIMSHEITHAVLRSRAGWWLRYPQWFDEGLAVLVARDPRFVTVKTDPGGCRFEPPGDLPQSRTEWLTAAGDRTRVVYGEAACAVARWLDMNGGFDALPGVIADARSGRRSLP